MRAEHDLVDLLQRQHGVATRSQLRKLGLDWDAIQRRIDRGQLEGSETWVLRLRGAPRTEAQRLMTCVLDCGADSIISHATAAYWWGIPGFGLQPINVSIERQRRRRDPQTYVIRHATVIPDEHRREHHGIPISSPALTLFHLAMDISPERLAVAVDRAWSTRLTSGAELTALLDRLARHGRNGIVSMRRVLDDRGADYRPPQSNLERRVLKILADGEISARPQVDLGDDRWTGRVDFLIEDRVVVEVQSERYHNSLTDREHDAIRRRRLEEDGFVVIEVWDREVFAQPWVVIERVRETLWALSRSF